MKDLRNKDNSIRKIWSAVVDTFGVNCFLLVDFWDTDNYSFGFRKCGKLIYVSTWAFREDQKNGIKCYSEFELIDEESFDTKKRVKQMKGILLEDLLDEIRDFLTFPQTANISG